MDSFIGYLRGQRQAITQAWLHAVQTSPDFTTADQVPVPQLIDHLPNLLEDLVDYLLVEATPNAADSSARAHGRHRWEQRFRVDELLREILLLRRIVLREIDRYQNESKTPLPSELEEHVRRRVERFFDEALVRSTVQFSGEQKAQIEKDRNFLASLHQSAQETAEQLQAVDAARLRLLRVISHELRNLLNAASLTAASLPGEEDPQWRDELHQMLVRNHRQMTALVNQLLDVAPVLSGSESLQATPLDLTALAGQHCRIFEKMAAAKGLVFELRVAPDLGTVVTDEPKLLRVLTNLVQNAIKYTDRGKVEVALSPAETGTFELCVSDTGPGIPSEHQARIFEEFHRVPGTDDREGTGLGLSIVRQLVGLLGGKIEVESRLGEGSTFRVRLPNQLAQTGKTIIRGVGP